MYTSNTRLHNNSHTWFISPIVLVYSKNKIVV